MPIYNKCCVCGSRIKVRKPRAWYLAKALEEAKTAVCSECDPRSAWTQIEKARKC